MSKFFIDYKSTVIDSLRKLRNPSSWLVIFIVVSSNKIPLFSKDSATFILSFVSLFVRVIHEPLIDEIPFLIFLPIILCPASTRISLFNFLVPVFLDFFTNESAIGFANDYVTSGSIVGPIVNSPNGVILDN